MPPRKSTRATKVAKASKTAAEAQNNAVEDVAPVAEAVAEENADVAEEQAGDEVDVAPVSASADEEAAAGAPEDDVEDIAPTEAAPVEAEASSSTAAAEASGSSAPQTMEQRMAKMRELRQKMSESARQNRQDVIADTRAHHNNARAQARLERKRAQAAKLEDKAQAQENGEDLERRDNWKWTIEEDEDWNKKKEKKARRADQGFSNYDDMSRKKYKKDMDQFKPDVAGYNRQKSAALERAALTAGAAGDDAGALVPSEHGVAHAPGAVDFYRDANTFIYGDHKPSEDAIDRVVGKLNIDLDKRQKRSRERKDEDKGDVTYINESNRVFNKKLDRYYSKYTEEIRENFERGTAL